MKVREKLVMHWLGIIVAMQPLACGVDRDDDDGAAMMAAIEDACGGHCGRTAECGFDDEVQACTKECIDSLSAGLDSNRACTEADVLLYRCLSTAPCETLPLGTSCQAEIERSMSACDGNEPEASSG